MNGILAELFGMVLLIGFCWLVKKYDEKKLHIHWHSKPIISMYVSFNIRNIIYECSCGHREVRKIHDPRDRGFPIETTDLITNKEFKKHLNNGIFKTSL